MGIKRPHKIVQMLQEGGHFLLRGCSDKSKILQEGRVQKIATFSLDIKPELQFFCGSLGKAQISFKN